MQERRGKNDLATIIFQLSSDRAFQFWRELRCRASDPGADRSYSWMAGYGSVNRSHYHIPDDPRTYRYKLRYFCRDADRRDPGSSGGYPGLHPAFLYHRYPAGKTVSEISETRCAAKSP